LAVYRAGRESFDDRWPVFCAGHIPGILLSEPDVAIGGQDAGANKERRPDLWRAHIADSVEDQELSDAQNFVEKTSKKDD